MKKIRLCIFASGSGSNAMKIMEFFQNSDIIEVALLLTNNKNAGILEKSKGKIDQLILTNTDAEDGELLVSHMKNHRIDYIALAGYLRKIPNELIHAFPRHIINIHPALLPLYGGKGMFGMHVHRAVHENKEIKSGITIHLVNEKYDEGEIIAQHSTSLLPTDSPELIQQKVLRVEHHYFAPTIERFILTEAEKQNG